MYTMYVTLSKTGSAAQMLNVDALKLCAVCVVATLPQCGRCIKL